MNPVHMECNITFSLFLNFFFEKFSVAHYPTLTLLPAQKKKKKVKIEFRMTNKSSHQGIYDIQYIAG